MAQQSICEHAEEFVRLGTEYFRLARVEAAYRQMARAESRAGYTGTADSLDEGMIDARRKRNYAIDDLTKLGPSVAEDLIGAGEDPTNLLTFLHTLTRGGGGLTAATPLWSTLKVQLQRVSIKGKMATGSTETDRPTIISAAVACERYEVNAQTIGEAVRDGSLTDYRPDGHAKNAPHRVVENEIADRWPKR